MGMENMPRSNNSSEQSDENVINSTEKSGEDILDIKESESPMSAVERLVHIVRTEVSLKGHEWITNLKEAGQKKLQVALLATVLAPSLTLVGCGSNSEHPQEAPQQTKTQSVEQGHESAFRGYELTKSGAEKFLAEQFDAERVEGGSFNVRSLNKGIEVLLSPGQYEKLIHHAEEGLIVYASRASHSSQDTGMLFNVFRKRVDLTISQIYAIQNGERKETDTGETYTIETEGGQIKSSHSEGHPNSSDKSEGSYRAEGPRFQERF